MDCPDMRASDMFLILLGPKSRSRSRWALVRLQTGATRALAADSSLIRIDNLPSKKKREQNESFERRNNQTRWQSGDLQNALSRRRPFVSLGG
ncbi:hypothetical protein VTI28DRAFT_8147 [Corynascus sepedonium]